MCTQDNETRSDTLSTPMGYTRATHSIWWIITPASLTSLEGEPSRKRRLISWTPEGGEGGNGGGNGGAGGEGGGTGGEGGGGGHGTAATQQWKASHPEEP